MKLREIVDYSWFFQYYIERGRQLGNTTALVELVKNNPKAILVVANANHAGELTRKNGLERGRIVSMYEFKSLIGKVDFYPVFDNFVLSQIFGATNSKLNAFSELMEKFKNEL